MAALVGGVVTALAAMICTADPREDIGHGVTLERRYVDGVLEGVAYWHPDGKGGVCEGWISFDDGTHGWQLVSERPLEVTSSLLCSRCGHHGFIRGGRWVPV